ncbi:MAG: helix-turn-helix domain-containing protein [Telluria sp.]
MNARDNYQYLSHRELPVEYTFQPTNPPGWIDRLRAMKQLHSDAELCRVLQVPPPMISKIRTGRINVSAGLMIRIHEVFQLPIDELRRMMAEQ